jgi:hypothetical protein
MSDTVNKADIEDVLSSIRRLVADDAPARQIAAETPAVNTTSEAQKPAALLLLTEALRVDLDDAVDTAAATAPMEEAVATAAAAEIEDNVVAFFTGDAKSPASQVPPYEDQEAEAALLSDADLSSVMADEVGPETSANSVEDDNMFQEHVMDEDALRELIGKLVREELRGELGEQISRNIRKLVRREIHRAMASIDLD